METLHPGIYLQEVAGENPIEGVSTSTGAFVGVAEKGIIGKSQLVTSWKDFLTKYGSYVENSYLAYAVRGFFENGGTRAFISRAVKLNNGQKTSAQATYELKAGAEVVAIIDAFTDGKYGNNIEVEVTAGAEANKYTLTVFEGGAFVEKFENYTLDELDDIVNGASTTIKFTTINETKALTLGKFKLAGGTDGLTGIGATDYVEALSAFDNDLVNIVAIPGITDVATIQGIVTYVEKRKDCTAIVETPLGLTPMEAIAFKNTQANIASARVAIYYSWIQVADPIGVGKNPTKLVPPSGHVAGIYARIDNTRGVFKAPAGLEAGVRGAIGVEYNTNDEEQDFLNPANVNAIRAFDGEGIVVWGARTTSALAEWKYVPVRRSADYVGQSILAGTRWAVFEPNDQELWKKITAVSESFLRAFWRAGGLKGATESDAFFVECNANTTTADDIDAGRLFANVGIAPQKPAEFVIFRLSLLK